MRFTSMRFTWAAISLICSVGAVAAQQVVPVSDNRFTIFVLWRYDPI